MRATRVGLLQRRVFDPAHNLVRCGQDKDEIERSSRKSGLHELMRQIADRLCTFQVKARNSDFEAAMERRAQDVRAWDVPKLDQSFMKAIEARRATAEGSSNEPGVLWNERIVASLPGCGLRRANIPGEPAALPIRFTADRVGRGIA